jgi:uncharacterized protein with von Willebrand factor type A (vWA) domain
MPSAAAVSPLQRIGEFAALLRDHGFCVGVDEQRCMLRVAQQLGPGEPSAVESAWRAIACSDQQDWRRWHEIFERFWWPQRVRGQVRVSQQTRRSRDLRQAVQDLHQRLDAESAGPQASRTRDAQGSADQAVAEDSQTPGRERAQGGASRTEALHAREHQMWLPQELAALQRLAADIAQRLRPRPTRRWRAAPARAQARLDLRATLRRSVAWGGEPLQAAWRVRRVEPPRLFILADVSRSMEAHGAFFLRVARAFAQQCDARVFVFHVRLAEVTALLRRDSAATQEQVNAVTAGFGAGTRIGACVQAFARGAARHQLVRGSRVWVFSDGFDTDAPELLGEALRALRGRGARISWFHPTRAVPQAAALQRARACIDTFVPLASIADLAAARKSLH